LYTPDDWLSGPIQRSPDSGVSDEADLNRAEYQINTAIARYTWGLLVNISNCCLRG